MPQSKTSKMTEVRQTSSQQNQSHRWIKNLVGVILAALLLFVLFKELHSLSKGLEESRKSLEELSNRLAEEEKKNEKFRKELGHVKEKMDNMLQVFSNMQKVSRAKRAAKHAHNGSKKLENRCKKLKHCAEKLNKGVNCTTIKNCMASRGKDLIHAYKLRFTGQDQRIEAIKQGSSTLKLSWKDYIPTESSIVSRAQFSHFTAGIYYVYCHLRVGQYVKKVIIRTNTSELFSTFTSNRTVDVRMFGLAEIPSNALLYVEVEFKKLPKSVLSSRTTRMIDALFPDYSDSEQSPNLNSFGMFLVS